MNLERLLKNLDVKVMIFNNDEFKECIELPPWIGAKCYEGYPHVMVYVIPRNMLAAKSISIMEGVRASIEIKGDGTSILTSEGELKITKSPTIARAALMEIRLDNKIWGASRAEIMIGSVRINVPVEPLVRVEGRVTDFKGNPRKAYIIFTMPYGLPGGTGITRSRNDGFYEIWLPEAIYHHVFICDEMYSRETLEFYAWYVPVGKVRRLDARYDKIEIYRLAAAQTPERTLIIDFVPMDILCLCRSLDEIYRVKGRVDKEDLCRDDIRIQLDIGDIEVYLDDVRLEPRTLAKRYYSAKDMGLDCLIPSYTLEAKIPEELPMGEYTLKIVVCKDVDGVKECGEAHLYGVRII